MQLKVLLSLLVIGAAIFYWRLKREREKRDRERLEELLNERTKEIQQSREQLANLNEKKDLIFSILSHDLRSPLTTLKGFLGLLVEDGNTFTKEELRRYVEQIRNSVSTSLDLIDNTLFWSLSQMGSIQHNPERLLVSTLIEKVEALHQLAMERKYIQWNVQVENNLMVFADENMLYVTLRNLVSNAIKFTPSGKEIFVRAFKEGNTVQIEVKDQGIGMSTDYIQKLIQRENPAIKKGTSNEKGTGLGFILCQQFVEMNNGTLSIVSEEGKGSTFTIILPNAVNSYK